jgi:hypothetical protein
MYMIQVSSQKILGCYFFLSYIVNVKCWLNWFMDDHHLNFITKIRGEKKTNKHQLIIQKPKMNLYLFYKIS